MGVEVGAGPVGIVGIVLFCCEPDVAPALAFKPFPGGGKIDHAFAEMACVLTGLHGFKILEVQNFCRITQLVQQDGQVLPRLCGPTQVERKAERFCAVFPEPLSL